MRNKQALTTGDVAKYCGVSFRTVIRWIESGRLSAYRLPGRGDNRIHIDEFLRFLSEHDMPVPDDLTDGQRRVLIVETDQHAAERMAEALRGVGFETERAFDGFSAGALVETFSPAVITLDLHVLGATGEDIIRYVRQKRTPEQAKVLVISAQPLDELRESASASADDFLQKPVSDAVLVDKVAELAGLTVSRSTLSRAYA